MSSAPPDFVSFDAAQTLVRVEWNPAQVALESAAACGLESDPQVAGEVYLRLLATGWAEYKALNRSKDFALVEGWWMALTTEWAARMGWEGHAEGLYRAAEEVLYGPQSRVFQLFHDTLPCLEKLKAAGLRCGVVSNWDMSLHRVSRTLGLTGLVEFVLCSDEEGFEKPDPSLFHLACEKAGVEPGRTLHVGDNPVDDVQGAHGAGLQALLLDRKGGAGPGRIGSLDELPGLLGL